MRPRPRGRTARASLVRQATLLPVCSRCIQPTGARSCSWRYRNMLHKFHKCGPAWVDVRNADTDLGAGVDRQQCPRRTTSFPWWHGQAGGRFLPRSKSAALRLSEMTTPTLASMV